MLPLCHAAAVAVVTTCAARATPDTVTPPARAVGARPTDSAAASGGPVEMLGVVSAAQLRDGLGFAVEPSRPWELQLARDVGAREVRMQFGWNDVEPAAGRLVLTPVMREALATAARLGLRPLIVAAYGPASTRLPLFTLRAPAARGDSVLSLELSPALADVRRGHSYAQAPDGSQLVAEGYWAYQGAYVSSVDRDSNRVVLAAPLTRTLNAGERVAINNRLYPPPVAGAPNDSGLAAYVRYARFLAAQLAGAGLAGHVELWNEPAWAHDRWDGGEGCFFASGVERSTCRSINYDLAKALLGTAPPGGVRYTWGGTHKTGFATLITGASGGIRTAVTREQIEGSVSEESFHPYGRTPEWHAWNPDCLSRPGVANVFATCALVGTNPTSNFKWARKVAIDHLNLDGWTIDQTVSEAGIRIADAATKARYLLRFYLAHHALGFRRIDFYRLADAPASGPNYGVVDANTREPMLPYRALQALMNQLDDVGTAPPAEYDNGGLPTVVKAQTTWPVTTVVVAGRRSGAVRNTMLLTLWQRPYPKTGREEFEQISRPDPGRVAVRVPTGYHVVRAWSLVDQSPVAVVPVRAGIAEVRVTDDPVAMRFAPR
ncbi:hypothetical protein tb265_15880 [Gemmatimonadetes bacterium T265]|nr:hypothetical protein tb265_15880 [Gemmatimonadetes bacterium T265]